MTRPTMSQNSPETLQAGVLGGLLAEARTRPDSLIIFDLDDTLLSTTQRHLRILREFAATYPDADALAETPADRLHYSVTDTAKAAGTVDATLLKNLREFWFARFFLNEYIQDDEETPGASLYCRDALDAGARIVYLTGRDVTMSAGTIAALARHGFPIPDDETVTLILKPRFDMPDVEYKKDALDRISTMGTVAGSFDNEPAHVNLFYAAFPDSRTVFVDTKHCGKPIVPHPNIPWIRNFLRKG